MGVVVQDPAPKPAMSVNPPRFLLVGAGSRGNIYARCITDTSNGIVAAIAEPNRYKRETLGAKYIWGQGDGQGPSPGQSFEGWRDFIAYEEDRRARAARGEQVAPGVDGVFVCVLDEQHREVVVGLAPLGLHIMCEKPLACSLQDCVDMYRALKPFSTSHVFSVGHVLRYSPHNRVLRRLLVEDKVIGDIASVNHTEPIGWWHFTHSYVRGNWRNSKTTGPSLLTKSCHDIDLLLWLLCFPEKAGQGESHFPESIYSHGALQLYKKSRKPAGAGDATNCMKCPLADGGCQYSAANIYLGEQCNGVASGNTKWPLNVLVPDIEDMPTEEARAAAVCEVLAEDYPPTAAADEVSSRNWFGRCVFESDNDVCDDQVVTLVWPETDRPAKRATFHMVSQTTKLCQRYSHFYGSKGEIHADSQTITVEDFETGAVTVHRPHIEDEGHGGGDPGLTRQFVLACDKVKNHQWEAARAQNEFVACTLDDALMSHALVFAAEEARLGNKVVDWAQWWDKAVAGVAGI